MVIVSFFYEFAVENNILVTGVFMCVYLKNKFKIFYKIKPTIIYISKKMLMSTTCKNKVQNIKYIV